MFFHYYKYTFLQFFRNRVLVFWTMLFPIILSIMFNFAFSNLYENTVLFTQTPIAVVTGESSIMRTVLDEMSKADNPLFEVHYTDKETAAKMLEDNDVIGIITDDGIDATLTVKPGNSIEKSIIKSFLEQYRCDVGIITEIAMSDPSKISAAVESISAELNTTQSANYTDGNLDSSIQYFSNLLAMTCMFASISSMYISILNQANLSDKGARVNIAPINKFVTLTSAFLAVCTIQYIGLIFATGFLLLVLKIDFGVPVGYIMLINLVGVLFGAALGFFVGAIGNMSEGVKRAILLASTMLLCLFSGLYSGDMYIIIENKFPLFNRINPATLIADSFYSINIYGVGERFIYDIGALGVLTVLLIIGGFLLTRSRKYQSL